MSDLQNNAMRYALKLLSYRERSEKELEDRLIKKGINKRITTSTIKYLKSIGLINDFELANNLKRIAISNKLLSQNGAKRFIIKRGIPLEVAEQVLPYNENIEIQNAKKLVQKKLVKLKNYSRLDIKKKLYGHLIRRGYSLDIIKKVLNDEKLIEEDY